LVVTVKELQSEINARLRPWLDLAALVPFDSSVHPLPNAEGSLIERVFQEGCAPDSIPGADGLLRVKGPLARGLKMFPNGISADLPTALPDDYFALTAGSHFYIPDRRSAARIFYALFYNVRFALECIEAEGERLRLRLQQKRPVQYPSSFTGAFFGFSQNVRIDPEGGVEIEDHPVWAKFKAALRGVHVDRLRRCPECRRIYYAVRNNKRACDAHLALAAVKRSQRRKKEKAAEYELNRRASRLAKRKGIGIGEALKQVRTKSSKNKAHKKRENEDGKSI
jgi:hypothetical protein